MKRILVLALALLMALTLSAAVAEEPSFEEKTLALAKAAEPTTLPLTDSGEQLTIYMEFAGSQVYDDMEQHPVIQKFQEMTGVDIVVISPPEGDDGTFFNTIVASGDWPDLFRSEFNTYPGGVAGAIDDGVLLEWNPLVEQYMPNFLTKLAGMGEKVYKHLVNDDGTYIKLGCYLDPPVLDGVQHTGLVIRKDMLDALGAEVPKTIEELTEVMRRLKNELGVAIPFAMCSLNQYVNTNNNAITGAWDVALDAYMIADDDSVYYSRTTDAFKDALKTLNAWYNEGLIDRDFINRSPDDAMKLLYSDDAAICAIGNWSSAEMMNIGTSENADFEIVGLPIMRLSDPDQILNIGGKRENGTDGKAWQNSATCKNPRLAAKFIDFLFTDEALVIATFGIGDLGDGNSTYYVAEDGSYHFTDYMMNNPDWDFNAMRQIEGIQAFQYMYHNDFINMQYDTDIQKQCWEAWGYNLTNDKMMPVTISRTVEEGRTYSSNQNEIQTYSDEMMYKFICNELPIDDNWDEYLKMMDEIGLQENIDIQTAAYQRWLNR